MLSITGSSISITSRPRIGAITQSWNDPENAHSFSAEYNLAAPMEAIGSVTFGGGAGAAGWTVGFMQAISLVDWAIYRGATPATGSVLLRKGLPFGQAGQTCFDAERPGTRYQRAIGVQTRLVSGTSSLPCATTLPANSHLPVTVEVVLQDQPQWFHAYLANNSRTGQLNQLAEARAEITLCAVLAATNPAGVVQILGGWIWTVLWQNRFEFNMATHTIATVPVGSGNRCTVGAAFSGPPTDPRFTTVFTGMPHSTCNIEQNRGSAVTRVETTEWTSFDVPR